MLAPARASPAASKEAFLVSRHGEALLDGLDVLHQVDAAPLPSVGLQHRRTASGDVYLDANLHPGICREGVGGLPHLRH